jgi:hypothetical protein
VTAGVLVARQLGPGRRRRLNTRTPTLRVGVTRRTVAMCSSVTAVRARRRCCGHPWQLRRSLAELSYSSNLGPILRSPDTGRTPPIRGASRINRGQRCNACAPRRDTGSKRYSVPGSRSRRDRRAARLRENNWICTGPTRPDVIHGRVTGESGAGGLRGYDFGDGQGSGAPFSARQPSRDHAHRVRPGDLCVCTRPPACSQFAVTIGAGTLPAVISPDAGGAAPCLETAVLRAVAAQGQRRPWCPFPPQRRAVCNMGCNTDDAAVRTPLSRKGGTGSSCPLPPVAAL